MALLSAVWHLLRLPDYPAVAPLSPAQPGKQLVQFQKMGTYDGLANRINPYAAIVDLDARGEDASGCCGPDRS